MRGRALRWTDKTANDSVCVCPSRTRPYASDASRGHSRECYRVRPAQGTCRLTRALRRFSLGPGARALSPESEP